MSNVEQRPYVGTWVLNNRTVVKYTPDALVFINGDTSLPGCARCRGRIEVQQYVTGLSVEAGTDPLSHSATINLALPRMQGKQVFIDGYNILRPGLEVHIFLRGYFPIRGMFAHLANQQSGPEANQSPRDTDQLDLSKYATYPYYPAFHGLITQVSYEYSDGFYYGTLNCTSLLHFWQFVNITTAGAWMAQEKRPTQDSGRPTLYGHNFNNTHPFSIIYTLYRDVAGSAAGVDFALGEETDLDASVGASMGNDGRQIFSMVSMYWTQRFKTRIQNLRMYGVNGQLFNGVQQAWLGTNRDVNGLLTSSTANDPTTKSSVTDPFAARYSVAKSLGLQGAGADFTYSPLIQQDNEFFNLSVLDMYAFNQAIADMGANNLWQSTYQTKMDIAQQVMEVTGYEFYQDVDGDLVFKPPFWNLDTAPNRFYRLEDSDIINITFTEKEPNATYIIVRGVWIPGLTDVTPPDDVLLKRGLYIDYKLVAQFGWRPAPTLELTYVTDPKVLFWIGVARLDMLNVDTFSATATIPIRAELRPGFPVYIPFADCYYYIRQLSHSFSFGGQCTTSLVLTCRRAKFHAPGFLEPQNEGDSAIKQIRLDRPDLPPRPLEAYVNDIPRLVGFPNVVMALDPRKFNPNFSVVGIGIDYFDNVEAPGDLLFNLLVRDIHLIDAFQIEVPAQGPDGKNVIEDPTQVTRLKLQTGSGPNDFISFTVDDLRRGFSDLKSAQTPLQQAESRVNAQADLVAEKDRNFSAFELAKKAGGKVKGNPGSDRATATDRLDVLDGELENERIRFNEVAESSPSISTLVQIFEALQPNSNKPIRRKIDGIPGSDVRLSYFETLSHLKGQYLAGAVPGNYRYFSCSHPDEKMQGMPIIQWDDGERAPSPNRGRTRRVQRRRQTGGRTQRGRTRFEVSPASQQRFNQEAAKLQALLDERGVSWINANALLAERNNGSTTAKGVSRSEVRSAVLTDDLANNLANISQAVQELDNRLAARPDFGGRGFFLQKTSAWRISASVEDSNKVSQHQLGKAVDIRAQGPGIPAKVSIKPPTDIDEYPEPLRTGYTALKDEASKMWVEGFFGGYGFYEDRLGGSGVPFIHVDVREGAAKWAENQGVATYNSNNKIKAGCRKNSPNNVPGCIAGALSVKGKARVRLDSEIAAAKAAVGTGKQPLKRFPLTLADLPPAEPAPAQEEPAELPPTEAQPSPVLAKPPSINVREISLEVPRTVVQFKEQTKRPSPDRRAPEVILSTGKCRQGIQVALGPSRTPQVLTTDQIQRVHFVRHQASKFTEVAGVSQNSGGTYAYNAVSLQKAVFDIFSTAAQELDDTSVTVASVFRPIYEEIGTNLEAIPIPQFDPETGDELDPSQIQLVDFADAVAVESKELPPSVLEQLAAENENIDPEVTVISVGDFTFKQLGLVPGYKTTGDPQANGQGSQRPVLAAASAYATSIVRQVERGNNLTGPEKWIGYQQTVKNASTSIPGQGTSGKQDRMAKISTAFNLALEKSLGRNEAVGSTLLNAVIETVAKTGKDEKPIHSPVFPVSDEKGYEHYGAYRYGRGLSVEPGGTFEFIHSGKDPFRNVTAQSAEEFLRVMTLVKTGRIDGDTSILGGIKKAALDAVESIFNQKQDPLSTEGLSSSVAAQGSEFTATAAATNNAKDVVAKVGLTEFERVQVEQSAEDLAATVTRLGQTARGQDVLRELLEANGDDPNILKGKSFDISQTQFLRNFVNFAANFGKSPVFKTTAANAAYRLSDLTAHLINRAGRACICRGSYADVTMEAYSRDNLLASEGLDTVTEKAEAFASEKAIQLSGPHASQQKRVRGAQSGVAPDAGSFEEGRTTGAGASGTGINNPPPDVGTVSAENPPSTVNPDEFAETGAGVLPDLDPDTPSTPLPPDAVEEVPDEPTLLPDLDPNEASTPLPPDPIEEVSDEPTLPSLLDDLEEEEEEEL